MELFYIQNNNIVGDSLSINGEEFHHLTHVLRKKVDEVIKVTDGKGIMYTCKITDISHAKVHCRIEDKLIAYNEPSVTVSLCIPILKNHNRIEWIIEKGTELGVSSFIPIVTERTIGKSIRYDRLQKIAITALKQCQRSVLPIISGKISIGELLRSNDTEYDEIFVGHEETESSEVLSDIYSFKPDKKILVVIGPEGGLSPKEIELCRERSAKFVSLGKRRLRSETAAICLVAGIIRD